MSFSLADINDATRSSDKLCPTFLSLPASFFESAIDSYDADDKEVRRKILGGKLRFLLTAMASKEMLMRFDSVGLPVYETYGITELGIVSWNSENSTRYGTVGKPLDPTEITFSGDGELIVNRKFPLCIGYYTGVSEISEFTYQYTYTGDLAAMDKDGFLSLKGRKKNVVNTKSGESYQLEMIEASVQKLSGVEFAAALYDVMDDSIICYVVPDMKTKKVKEDALVAAIISLLDSEFPDIRNKSVVIGLEKPSMKNGTMTRSMKLDRNRMLELVKAAKAYQYELRETMPHA